MVGCEAIYVANPLLFFFESIKTTKMNLKKLFRESGHKAVAQEVLREYSSLLALKRPPKKKKIQIMVPEILYNYVKITARSPGKIGERFEEIILKDIRSVADEGGLKLY